MSQTVEKNVRLRAEGSSFGPSDWNLAAASASDSPHKEANRVSMEEIAFAMVANDSNGTDGVPCHCSLNFD